MKVHIVKVLGIGRNEVLFEGEAQSVSWWFQGSYLEVLTETETWQWPREVIKQVYCKTVETGERP